MAWPYRRIPVCGLQAQAVALAIGVPQLDIPDVAIALDPLDGLVGPWHRLTTVKANRLR